MGDVVKLPRRDRALRESDIIASIRRKVGSLPWVVLWRNNTGSLPDARGILVHFGLCKGSSDFIGIVQVTAGPSSVTDEDGCSYDVEPLFLGRFFALEVKKPGERPRDAQDTFLKLVRKMGGFAAWVNNVDDAMAALERARDPRCSE